MRCPSMDEEFKKGKGLGVVLDSTPNRPAWYLGADNYHIEQKIKNRGSWKDSSIFSVMFCLNCNTAFEFFYSSGLGMVVDYYKDFPSISCQKETCPKCL